MVTMLKPRLAMQGDRLKTQRQAQPGATQRIRGRAWMEIKDRILTRDAGICRCQRCKATGALKPAHEVDHIIELWEGGTNDDSNLQSINWHCHQLKTAGKAKARAGG